MPYTLVLDAVFEKHFRKLDRVVQRRIFVALYELAALPNPAERLKPLQYSKAGLFRLRVGDYRVIVALQHTELVIIAVDVGHRKAVYG